MGKLAWATKLPWTSQAGYPNGFPEASSIATLISSGLTFGPSSTGSHRSGTGMPFGIHNVFSKGFSRESKGFPSWGPNGLVKDFPKGKGLLKDCLRDSRRLPKDSPRDSKGLPRNSPKKF